FLPLGMTKTWVRADPGQIIPRRSIGYIPGEGGFREVRDLHGAAGAGGRYTPPGGLAEGRGNLRTAALGGPGGVRKLARSDELRARDLRRHRARSSPLAAWRQ